MKKSFCFILAAAVSVISAGLAAVAGAQEPEVRVVVYYFHGSFRCPTCNAMEKYSREAIETNYGDALKAGELEFMAVNVEDRGNEHFVKDYGLYTKALILSLVKDGKEVRSKNLNKIWELAKNKKKFVDYVAVEIGEFMKGAQ